MGQTPLRPCPFCGNEDVEVEREGNSRQSCIVICGWCGCRMESNENGAGDAWNRRTPPPATKKMMELTKGRHDVIKDMNLPQFWDIIEAEKAFLDEWS